MGRLIQQDQMLPNQQIKLGEQLKSGAYFIEVMQGDQKRTRKVLKFK